jgi:hypothetical protein
MATRRSRISSTGSLGEFARVTVGVRLAVDRHLEHARWVALDVREELAVGECEIAVWMSARRDAFIDLVKVDAREVDRHACECPERGGRTVPA